MKVVVVGAVAGGMSFSSKIKRNLKENVEINVYEMGEEISFGACGIPFYISNKIKNASDLIARSAEDFKKQGINILVKHQVVNVFKEKKEVLVRDLQTGVEFLDKYDYLVVASGASVNKFKPLDEDYDNLYVVRNVSDGTSIKEALRNDSNKNVLVVGAGFIGLEVVESASVYQKNVSLVELSNHVLSGFDEEISLKLEEELKDNQVNLFLESKLVEIKANNRKIESVVLETKDGLKELSVDILINAAGITPNTNFIDVEKIKNGAIIVDEVNKTSDEFIFAAGDCSVQKSFITNDYLYAPLGTNANKQGRIIADYLSNVKEKPFKLLGSSCIKLFGLEAAKIGLSEKEAIKYGFNYKTNFITGNSFASYYGEEQVSIKLVYDQETRVILGCQTVGKTGSVYRANYYALAILNQMSVDEMGFVDLAYSPPFSGVWDVSLIASNTAK